MCHRFDSRKPWSWAPPNVANGRPAMPLLAAFQMQQRLHQTCAKWTLKTDRIRELVRHGMIVLHELLNQGLAETALNRKKCSTRTFCDKSSKPASESEKYSKESMNTLNNTGPTTIRFTTVFEQMDLCNNHANFESACTRHSIKSIPRPFSALEYRSLKSGETALPSVLLGGGLFWWWQHWHVPAINGI